MDKENSTNLVLDQPRLLLPEDSPLGRGIFYMVLMALGGLGGWGCLITAFQISVYPAVLAAAGLFCCGFAVWRQMDSRKRWWSVSLVGWVFWLMVLVFQFDSVAHGAVRTLNFMLDGYGSKLNYDLPVFSLSYSVGSTRPDVAGECTAFMGILMLPFFWAMGRMWVHSRNDRGPFALTGLLLLLPMSFSILPAGWAFGVLMLFWCMMLLLSASLSGRAGAVRKKGYKASGVAVAQPAALMLLLAVGLCMWGVYRFAPLETYERPELAENLRAGLREGFGASQYLRGGQGNSNKEVQLNTLGSRAYTGETMLRVKFDWQADQEDKYAFEYMQLEDGTIRTVQQWDTTHTPAANGNKEYLKSFVGSVYTGESWERLPQEEREELNELDLVAQNQIAQYKDKFFLAGRDKLNRYHLSVQNLGANPRCVYIPASMSSGPEDLAWNLIEFVDDGYVKSGSFLNGTREYELDAEARTNGYNYFSRIVAYVAFKRYGVQNLQHFGSAAVGGISRDDYGMTYSSGAKQLKLFEGYSVSYPILEELFEQINSQSRGLTGWPADLWKMQECEAWDGLSREQQEMVRAVEDYNDFVYEHYTRVPEELEDFLTDFREAYDLDPDGRIEQGDFRYMDGAELYAARIARRFQDYFTYTLDPPPVPQGQDFVEFFLGESYEGYCVHFASAAVLLLRSAGYPARYAEGYVVPSMQSGWVDVPDYNAHAWVEVYCGGTGWVPVEVTPAALDNPAAFIDATMPENPQEYIPTPQPDLERPTMPPRNNHLLDDLLASPSAGPSASAEPNPGAGSNGGDRGKEHPLWPVMGWCALGLLAAIGVLMLNRALCIYKRKRELGQKDRSAAGLRAYAYLLKLYEKELLCGMRGDPPERWKELAEKARFAKQMLSGEELAELTGDAQRLAEKLRRQLPRGQKLWCWLLGLI